MTPRKIAVLGAGTAGLSAALTLARDGHRVVLVERDVFAESDPAGAFAWKRDGISHFLQPHAFIPRGRHELKERFPDVYATLIEEGAHDLDARSKLPGPPEPGDEVLQYMAVRRPLIEWSLRKAVLSQPGIETLSGAAVSGIRLEGAKLGGVGLNGRVLDAEVVVDAMGRRSPMRGWLGQHGHGVPPPRTSQCGVIYYARYYRVRPGIDLPDGPWILGPRGELGYMSYSTFPGDNRTFAIVLGVPTGVADLKIFMHEPAFEAAVGGIPTLMQWAGPELCEPITGVLPMGGMQNSLGVLDEPLPAGVFPVADALCHTDPVLAHGLSFSLIHALELARALRSHADVHDARAAYRAAIMPTLTERYEFATALDEQRLRMWTGGDVDFRHRDGDYALFSLAAAGAVAMVDPEVFRVFVRRMGLLDSTRVLDENEPLKERIERRFGEMMAKPRPAPGPAREEMLALARASL